MFHKIEDLIDATLRFSEEDCYCGIPEFYDCIAEKLGYISQTVRRYDCTKVSVSKPIQDRIYTFYKDNEGWSEEQISAAWLIYGPKTDISSDECFVNVQQGFILEWRT